MRSIPRGLSSRSRGSGSLVGMLASVCILLLLALVTMGLWGPAVSGGSAGGKKKSLPARVMGRAHDTECASQLYQYRQSAAAGGMFGDPLEAGPPARAEEIGDPAQMKCPLCGLPYRYDPSQYNNGKYGISCRYPAHQGL